MFVARHFGPSLVVPTIAEPARRESVYQKALAVYGARPDLQGKLLLALAEDLTRQGKTDKALSAFEQAALNGVDVPAVVLTAAKGAEAVLLQTNRREAVVRMYTQLMAKTTNRTKIADAFRQQTSHYQLGLRLAGLLTEAGQGDAAKRVLAEIGAGASEKGD